MPHLEDLLPLISIEEAKRIQTYFHNAYIFHLNNGLRIPNIFPKQTLNPVPDNDTEPLQQQQQPGPADGSVLSFQQPAQEQHETQPVSDSVLSSLQPAHEQESIDPVYTQKTAPLMQSTPLSVPFFGLQRMHNEEEHSHAREPEQDVFLENVISQINISPITMHSAISKRPSAQPLLKQPIENVIQQEVTFLKDFENIQREPPLVQKIPVQNPPPIRGRKRARFEIERILRGIKKKMDKINFDVLCCLAHKNKSDVQLKRSEESFLYFPLKPGKTKNILSRIISNTRIPEGRRGHISMERIINFSNVLRAHASQSHSSVEQPIQSSQIDSTRSPYTPQDLLRTSHHLPFTPLRGDMSGLSPRMVIDQAASAPTHSLLRQQPLLPIPERESSINIPFNNHFEEIPIEVPPQSQNTSVIPLPLQDDPSQLREVPEILEDQLLQIAYNEASQCEAQQNKVSLNDSVVNVELITENEPIAPLPLIEDQSRLPGNISGDFDNNEQPQPLVDSVTTPPETVSVGGLDSSTNVPTTISNLGQEPVSNQVPMQLEQSLVQNPAIPYGDEMNDNLRVDWYQILRPRVDLVEYPQEPEAVQKKKRKRRRRPRDSPERVVLPNRNYELPLIPRSPPHENINDLKVAPVGVLDQMPSNHKVVNLEQQIVGLDNMTQNITNVVSDLPEIPLSPPAFSRYSEEQGGSSDQIETTQIEKYLKLIKRAGQKLGYANWETFDSNLFNENDRFELYTNIFKRIIKDKYVTMENCFENQMTRLEAAKGFKFILDLKTIGVIEIESMETQIKGFQLKSNENTNEI
ncbi:uncharacterized protein LOC129921058 isoform X3 [Episyrphus balteatus]|uniref:uncharacterized protein LOC129921058 isoform X2 n=1 Tax=Episyrphus balteatus TaxID=286459 RepID=UPI0024856156|nr:uncharacterized protein LOC129921058 isoform X2 [Episyrphus balteatus]XP_055858671.1 uncharacterized protein LOC129921058 isoform X3 [Episyrphus balteatus]